MLARNKFGHRWAQKDTDNQGIELKAALVVRP